jgi:hypothetical protein
LNAVFNETWDIDAPRLNLTEVAHLKTLIIPKLVDSAPPATSSMIIIWNVFLSVIVAILLFKTYFQNMGFMMGIPMLNQVRSVVGTTSQVETHHSTNLTLVLVFLIIFLGIIAGIFLSYYLLSRKLRGARPMPEISNPIPVKIPDVGVVFDIKAYQSGQTPAGQGIPRHVVLGTPEAERIIRILNVNDPGNPEQAPVFEGSSQF